MYRWMFRCRLFLTDISTRVYSMLYCWLLPLLTAALSPIDQSYLEYITSPSYKEPMMPQVLSEECFRALVAFVEHPSENNLKNLCKSSHVDTSTRLDVSELDYIGSAKFLSDFELFLTAPPEATQLLLYYLHTDLTLLSVADSHMSSLIGQLISQLHFRSILGNRDDSRYFVLIHLFLVDLREQRIGEFRSAIVDRIAPVWSLCIPCRHRRHLRFLLRDREQAITISSRKEFSQQAHVELDHIRDLVNNQLDSESWSNVLHFARSEIVPSLLAIARVADSSTLSFLFELVSLVEGTSSPSYCPTIIRIVRVATADLASTIPSV